jgi:amino acid transporter
VRRALGPFWGFQEAWLSLAASVFDMAIYPTLFTLYLGQLFPPLANGWPAVAVGAAMIGGCVVWNLRGGAAVGRGSVFLGAMLLGPFVALTLAAVAGPAPTAPAAAVAPAGGLFVGLFVAMWNYMGWDNASTFAPEVDRPQRTYPLAMLATIGLICATYVIPVLAARHAGLDPRPWTTGSWVSAGAALGGRWLGWALVLGGVVAPLGTFNALVLSYSQLPVVLAEDGYLPKFFTARIRKSGAPWVAILACAAAYACCLGLGFQRLVQIDILLYGLSLILEFAALVRLRLKEPDLPRPFRVPGGLVAAVALGVPPTVLLGVAMVLGMDDAGATRGTLLALALVIAGPPLFWALARAKTRPEAVLRNALPGRTP